ncbi:MAG: glycosyltransferase [Fimbriimonadaceae bacterium]|nr:glycosyltransferase [Fimbriimonadaceae bacterium]QYK56209.1 MAG: glycosyltransferase [Fimbriimonadaceae bacterium]
MSRLKVAIFSDSALPVLNGVSVSIDGLIGALREQGHSVHLYTTRYRGHRDSDPNVHRFFSTLTPWTPNYPLSIPPFYPWFDRFRREDFDIVHTHTPFTVGFVGLRWAESCGIPIVSTYHTHYDKYIHYVPFFPKRYLKFKIAKHTNYYYEQVDHVVTPSEASKRWLNRHAVRTPITVIPTGVPNPRQIDRAEVRQALGASPDQTILLYTGRVAGEKNIGVLLEAFQMVFSANRNAVMWVVGDGPARADYTQMASDLGIGDRIKFWGFIDRDKLGDFYAAADIFWFSSMTETQGLVVAEAMSYGLPCLVVQGGGASTHLESGVDGFVLPNDPSDLAETALRLQSDERLYTRISAAARKTASNLSVTSMAEDMASVYRGVIGARQELRRAAFVV